MAFWSGDKLERRLREQKLIKPFKPCRIDCAAYELGMGGEIYVSPSRHEENADRETVRILGKDESFAIPPGQFALLITEEKVTVPEDAIAFISMKAKIKFTGLVNVSGFHVDPGYCGKILFSVFNAGPAPVHVKHGERLFLIWYADLDVAKFDTRHKKDPCSGHKGIDPDYVNKISGSLLSLKSLEEEQKKMRVDMEKYKITATIMTTLLAAVLVTVILPVLGRLALHVWEAFPGIMKFVLRACGA